jgi:hypothetical protein
MAEYSVVTTSIELIPEQLSKDVDEFNAGLITLLNQIVQNTSKACQKVEGGNWHILSHALTRIDNHLVVSFLLRR